MRRSAGGFTLIELMVVVTIVAIIASIAIPNMMSARSSANEKTVIATMRSIVTAQQLGRTNNTVDVNTNGQGESMTLPELAGTVALRGTTTFLRPAFLSAALGQVDADGHALSHQFYFALYLPDATGVGLSTTAANLPNVDSRLAEHFWTCLAWPLDRRVQGYGTFFTYQAGDIMVAKGATYSGKTSIPPAGAALVGVPSNQINSNESAAGGGVAADGNAWRIVP